MRSCAALRCAVCVLLGVCVQGGGPRMGRVHEGMGRGLHQRTGVLLWGGGEGCGGGGGLGGVVASTPAPVPAPRPLGW